MPNMRKFEKRDIELENIVRNLLVAQYLVDKLQSRLSERVGYFGSMGRKDSSTFVFNKNDKWYRITLSAEKMDDVNINVRDTIDSQQ